ncbi:unnamed protein product [Urochloa humidicola]
MAWNQGRPGRGGEMGDRFKRRFEEDRGGDRFQGERVGGTRGEEDRRREQPIRSDFASERRGYYRGNQRSNKEEEETYKRRNTEQRRPGQQELPRERPPYGQGTSHASVYDRLGGGRFQGGGKDEQPRGKGITMDTRGVNRPKEPGICFWCRQDGHHQADCTNPPFCFRCKESGHIAARCPTSKESSMHMYGFGFPGQGFYCLKIPGMVKQKPVEHLGLIQVETRGMTEEKMEEELKNLIDDKWSWKVKKIDGRDFLAVFPNKQILDAFSRSKGCRMGLYNTWATFSPSTRDPAASSVLQTGWVQLHNIPDPARNVDAVTLIAELAGDVVAVDEVSLIKEEPVRVRLQAREIGQLRGIIEIFIEGVGYDIKFIPEKPSGKPTSSQPPPPPPQNPEDDYSGGDDDDDMLDSDDGVPEKRKSNEKGTQSHKGITSRGKQVAGTTSQEVVSAGGEEMQDPIPVAVYDPVAGQVREVGGVCPGWLDSTKTGKTRNQQEALTNNDHSGEAAILQGRPIVANSTN